MANTIQRVLEIDCEIDIQNVVIDCELEVGRGGRLPYYEGEYVAKPKAYEETILPTKNKSMKDDVKVLVIPTEEVSNLHGTTFAIAREGIVID